MAHRLDGPLKLGDRVQAGHADERAHVNHEQEDGAARRAERQAEEPRVLRLAHEQRAEVAAGTVGVEVAV